MSVVGDSLGRKTLMLINLGIVIMGILVIVVSQGVWMAGVGLFCCVFGTKNLIYLTLILST